MRDRHAKRRSAPLAAIALALVALTCMSVTVACGGSNQLVPTTTAPRTVTTQDGRFVVSYKPNLGHVPVNQMQSWTVHVETPSGAPVTKAKIAVSGGMADMGHGLPTAPRAVSLGAGDYSVQGLEFTMPGAWTVELRVTAGGASDMATFNLYLQ